MLRALHSHHFSFLDTFSRVRTPKMRAWRSAQLIKINFRIDAERDRLALMIKPIDHHHDKDLSRCA